MSANLVNFFILKKQICLLLFMLSQVSSGHEDDMYTIQYTQETFLDAIKKENNFVMFYAPWCGHCQRLSPTWAHLSKIYTEKDDNVKIAKVDCTIDSTLCREHDIAAYPTLKFFKAGESIGIKYKGARDLSSLRLFINDMLESMSMVEDHAPSPPEPVNGLSELTEESFHSHVGKGYHFIKFYAPWCGHCQKLAPIWEELANSLRNDDSVSISRVDCTLFRSICEQFEIKGYPTLLWIEDGKKMDKYTGQRTHEDLKTYVSAMHEKSTEQSTNKDESSEITIHTVLSLTGDSFEHSVEKGLSFVKFFAPWCGHCKRLAPIWEELGRKFFANENVHIAKVDCTLNTSKQLCYEQEVDGFPTLYLYRNGRKVSEYNGPRNLDDLYGFVMNHLRSHDEL